MIQITDKSDCCGCTACASICPHNAITMQPDAMGFLYPKVDSSKCTDCKLCEKICAFNADYDRSLNMPQPLAYAARHKNMQEVETSRSGAVFIAVSDWILRQGGVVYGAGYADHFRVVHKRATTQTERNEFKGSKYVQSDLGNVFTQVRQDLKEGRIVLFSGTPCQTAGLNAYIETKLRSNLYLMDIICHGVPGPYLWRDFISYLEKKQKDKICWVNFRDKQEFNWTAHRETFKFTRCEEKIIFKYSFYQPILFRKSCNKCPFANTLRPSDITLGDFWGWEQVNASLNEDDKGISLVLLNTEKGKQVFETVKQDINTTSLSLRDCLQQNLLSPTLPHPKRDKFEKDYAKHGFEYVAKRYGDIGWRHQLKAWFWKIYATKDRLLQKIR